MPALGNVCRQGHHICYAAGLIGGMSRRGGKPPRAGATRFQEEVENAFGPLGIPAIRGHTAQMGYPPDRMQGYVAVRLKAAIRAETHAAGLNARNHPFGVSLGKIQGLAIAENFIVSNQRLNDRQGMHI